MVTHVRIGDVDNRYALTRLAGKARQDGIKLYRDNQGRYFASSASKPGTMHYLTGYSCDCLGFVTHGRCKHHAALMAALGWISDTPEPTPPPPGFLTESVENSPTCPDCNGMGQVTGTVSNGRTWRYENTVCTSCHGTGQRTAAAA